MGLSLSLFIAAIVAGCGMAGAARGLPSLAPERWVNSAPLAVEALRDKVVLLDI
jgi:hypothetical protein